MSELIGYLSEVEQLNGELTIPKQLGGSTLGTKTITENDTYYAEDDGLDGYSEVTVNVSGGSTPTLETVTKTYTPTTSQQTETITPSSGYDGIGEVDVTVNAIPSQYIIPTGTKSISSNGTGIDVKEYEYADVAVPNSYSAADEGKVVSSGALVAQTAHADVTPTTSDQTIDTTTNNSIKVKGDVDLIATNIKKDVEIFGVTGSYEGGGGGGISIDDIASASITGDIVITETEIKAGAFWGNNGITSVTATNATTIGANALNGLGTCTIKVPNVVTVGKEAFSNTQADLYLPKITAVAAGSQWASTGGSGTILALPGLTGSIPSDGLRYVNATILDLGYTTEIKTRGIYQGNAKTVVILRSSSVVTASESNAIAAISSNTTVYVPSALVSSYQSATGWSARGCTFTALEGSIYEDEDWAA